MRHTFVAPLAAAMALWTLAAAAQPAPPPPAPAPTEADEEPPLAGWHGVFFLRSKDDNFQLFPRARLHVDFHAFAGPGVHDVRAIDGGNALKARLFARRLRFELAGNVFKRVDYLLGVDFGGQPIANANGKTQSSASNAGQEPTDSSARFAAVQSVSAAAAIANTWINLSIVPELNLMVGQEKAPFSLENRTGNNTHTWMERSLPIRSFVFPSSREIGLTVWGDLGKDKVLAYEVGVFGGDGQNRPQIDNRADFLGRVYARPLASVVKGPLAKAQIGLSAKRGDRDPDYVGYSYPGITSGQGFTFWDPRYRDSAGRQTYVLPSGAQSAIGGELRVPISRFDLIGEAYYVANDTREAIDGYQLTNTERLGSFTGVGWYAQLSAWVLGDAFVSGDPGVVRPTRLDFTKKPEVKKGLEVFGIVGGVHATYDGASREGAYDSKTPGAAGVASNIEVLQYGLGASYWYTRALKASLNFIAYHVPGSGSADNLAVAPGNIAAEKDEEAHVLYEIGTRFHVAF